MKEKRRDGAGQPSRAANLGNMRKIALISALALSLLLPEISFAGGTSNVVTLGKSNEISARQSAVTLVRIPRETRLRSEADSESIELEGRGRVIGFTLVSVAESSAPFSVDVTRWSFCDSRGCGPNKTFTHVAAHNYDPFAAPDGYVEIPPGIYRLISITDGAPVKMSLHLPELTGDVQVHLSKRAAVSVQAPKLTLEAEGNYIARAAPVSMPSSGLMIEGSYKRRDVGAGAATSCYTRQVPDPSGMAADPFHNGFCNASTGSNTGTRTHRGFWSWHPMAEGTWDSTFAYSWAGEAVPARYLNVWISFDGNAAPAP